MPSSSTCGSTNAGCVLSPVDDGNAKAVTGSLRAAHEAIPTNGVVPLLLPPLLLLLLLLLLLVVPLLCPLGRLLLVLLTCGCPDDVRLRWDPEDASDDSTEADDSDSGSSARSSPPSSPSLLPLLLCPLIIAAVRKASTPDAPKSWLPSAYRYESSTAQGSDIARGRWTSIDRSARTNKRHHMNDKDSDDNGRQKNHQGQGSGTEVSELVNRVNKSNRKTIESDYLPFCEATFPPPWSWTSPRVHPSHMRAQQGYPAKYDGLCSLVCWATANHHCYYYYYYYYYYCHPHCFSYCCYVLLVVFD